MLYCFTMEIKKYLAAERIKVKDFARILGIKPVYLSQIICGYRPVSKYLALLIEEKTNGRVRAEVLRPDIFLPGSV